MSNPDPDVDVELEKFCDWLSEEGHEPFSLSFEEMKNIFRLGRIDVARKRYNNGDRDALGLVHRWERELNESRR